MSKNYTIRCNGLNSHFNGTFTFNNAKFEAPGLLPGEKASVQLLYGKDKGKASVVDIIEPNEYRITPDCPYYDKCGGCNLLHLTYEGQLKYKTLVARELLSEYGDVQECEPAPNQFNYRNKMTATFSKDKKGRIVAGLYEESTHYVTDIKKCKLENTLGAKIFETIKKYMTEHNIAPYNEDTGRGIIRHCLVRTNKAGEALVAIVSGNKIFQDKKHLAEAICKAHPQVKTVVLSINTAKTTMVLGKKEEILVGGGFITDNMNGINFRISARSFYQINTLQAEKIYEDAIKRANISKDETILDAYCGIGTITAVAAKLTGAKEVIGVELNEAAVKDANQNAKAQGLTNLRFLNEDAGDYLLACIGADIKYDTVILDPPRSGASDTFIKSLLKMLPEKIIYISCNPETLARDLKHITKKHYVATYIKPYDMFPNTSHIESVCLLSRITKSNLKES